MDRLPLGQLVQDRAVRRQPQDLPRSHHVVSGGHWPVDNCHPVKHEMWRLTAASAGVGDLVVQVDRDVVGESRHEAVTELPGHLCRIRKVGCACGVGPAATAPGGLRGSGVRNHRVIADV